jgi:hypothetical protein
MSSQATSGCDPHRLQKLHRGESSRRIVGRILRSFGAILAQKPVRGRWWAVPSIEAGGLPSSTGRGNSAGVVA